MSARSAPGPTAWCCVGLDLPAVTNRPIAATRARAGTTGTSPSPAAFPKPGAAPASDGSQNSVASRNGNDDEASGNGSRKDPRNPPPTSETGSRAGPRGSPASGASPDTPATNTPANASNTSAGSASSPSSNGSSPPELTGDPELWLAGAASANTPRSSGPKGAGARRGEANAGVKIAAQGGPASRAPVLGLNFEEALAQSLNAAPADTGQGAGVEQPAQTSETASGDKTPPADSATLALALATQSLIGALGVPAAPGIPPATATAAGDASAGGGSASAGTAAAIAVTDGHAVQQLAALLSQDTVSAKGPSDAVVDATKAAKPAASDDAANATSAPPALGIASHFSPQSTASSSNTLTAEIRQPVGTPAWSDELGTQITWMAHQGVQSASLQLSPEHLGPLEVHISVRDGNASVWFGAAQADTRAALEQALPRLREMFATQGLTLADSSVSREPPRNHARGASQNVAPVSAITDGETAAPALRMSIGLIDTYV